MIAAAVPPPARLALLGAVDAARKREVRVREPIVQRAMAPVVAALREEVGATAEDVYAGGAQRTVEEAVRALWAGH